MLISGMQSTYFELIHSITCGNVQYLPPSISLRYQMEAVR